MSDQDRGFEFPTPIVPEGSPALPPHSQAISQWAKDAAEKLENIRQDWMEHAIDPMTYHTRAREVIQQAIDAATADLKGWQDSMLAVALNHQEIAKALGFMLGTDVRTANVVERIQAMAAILDRVPHDGYGYPCTSGPRTCLRCQWEALKGDHPSKSTS